MFTVGGNQEFTLSPNRDALALHFFNALFADPNTSSHQLFPYFWPAVFLFYFSMDGLDMHQQSIIADALARSWFAGLGDGFAPAVFKEAPGADRQSLAGQCDRPQGFVFSNQCLLHSDYRAKYTVVF